MRVGVVNLRLAGGQLPFADRGQNLQVRRERLDRHVEADLVVALAGAAVRDGGGAVLARHIDQRLGDQRAGQRGGQRVAALIERAGHQRGEAKGLGEFAAQVAHFESDRAGRAGPRRELLIGLEEAHIGGEAEDLPAALGQPAGHDGCIEAA